MNNKELQDEVARLLPMRRGHFYLESGHHGDLWLDLELLCLRPEVVGRAAAEIAARLSTYRIDVVCGPLVEGAFVALMVAGALSADFTYAERFETENAGALYPVRYRLPRVLREVVRGKRVAIINDVINAGSAIRGTLTDLNACGAQPVAIAALAVLGKSAATFATQQKLALEATAFLPNEIWTPEECPLCNRGVLLENSLTSKAGVI